MHSTKICIVIIFEIELVLETHCLTPNFYFDASDVVRRLRVEEGCVFCKDLIVRLNFEHARGQGKAVKEMEGQGKGR